MSSLDRLLKQIDDPSELSWKDETYDLALASGLTDAERETFISRLIDVGREGDPRAVLTLGYIGAVETLPALLALAKAQDPMAATARRAVVLLGHGAEVVQEIAHDAVHSPAKMVRVAAIMDLPKIGGEAAIAALEQALADQEYEVRVLAWEGLVGVWRLDPLIRSPEGKQELTTQIELLSLWLGSDIAAFVKMGVDGMREISAQLRAGADPKTLGIAWFANPAPDVFAHLRPTLFDQESSFPLDEIAQLTDVTRRWAESMIALRLEAQDPRVPEAMVRLEADWTLPVLEEVAQSAATSPELRDKLTQAVRALQAS